MPFYCGKRFARISFSRNEDYSDRLLVLTFALERNKTPMNNERCLIEDCTNLAYAPGGTASLCKEHFINFVTWRRRRGPVMFTKYAGMTMNERDTIVTEWRKSVMASE
jgi:hypothetical protein